MGDCFDGGGAMLASAIIGGTASMLMGDKKTNVPPVSAAPTAPEVDDAGMTAAARDAQKRARAAAAGARGTKRGTILTSPAGIKDDAPTAKKKLGG